MSRHDDDQHDPLVDEVVSALEKALGELDVQGLKSAVKKGLEEAARAIEPRRAEVVEEPDDNVVPLETLRGEVEPEADDAGEEEGVSVRVLTGGLGQGRLRVAEGWQTVWSGPEAVAYRLSLSRGQLEVVVDDQTVAQLLPGQTCDVGGRAIRVRGAGTGQYRRL